MSTPETVTTGKLDAQGKAMLLQAMSQLDMLVMAFASAPPRVKNAAIEFRESLKEWSENA